MLRAPKKEWFTRVKADKSPTWAVDYHGVSGFTIRSEQTTIVLDPFVSRPGLFATAFAPLKSNSSLIGEIFPVADAVAIGHSHHDHVLDAPEVCRQTGATFIGSPDAAWVARAAGISDAQIIETEGREDIRVGSAVLRGIPSVHGRVYLNRVPLPGSITAPPPWPPRVWHLRHGLVLNWLVTLGGIRLVHIDSADFVENEMKGMQADVVCLCAIGRQHRPDYVSSVVRLLRPKWIIPCHWDWFFTPYRSASKMLPGVDMEGFLDEVRGAGVTPVSLDIGGRFAVSHTSFR